MIVAFFAISSIIYVSFLLKSASRDSKLHLDDLLLGADGRLSKSTCILFGAFMITSWAFIFLAINNKLDSGVFLAYCGSWITPFVAKLIKK
jgi:hypothetical protein